MNFKKLLSCLITLFFLTGETFAQKPDAEILKYSKLCEVSPGKLVQTDSITIQINNRTGDTYAEMELNYSKTEKISDVEAWIEGMDNKRIRDLKKSDIIDRSAIRDISLYEDDYVKCFELKHNIYPYKVIYTYRKTYREFISVANWSPILYTNIPTHNATLKIVLPKNYAYRKFENNLTEPCKIDSTEKEITLQWKASYEKPIKSELFSQPADIKPSVIVAPLKFEYGVEGSTQDWTSYGLWESDLMKDLDVLPEDEKTTITMLIDGIKDKKEIVKTLYHYMQDHTRYINVTIGIGGMKPYPASYVAKNKYGDCKALTNYMKAVLNYAGIPSVFTDVYADDQPRMLNKDYVGQQFNHVVLAVPINKDTIWLENTSNINPFGYMGTFTQNRDALMVSKDQSRLVRIPALKKEENLKSSKLIFDLNLTGMTKVTLKVNFRGEEFETFNQINTKLSAEDKDKYIRNYMPFNNYEVIDWNLKKQNRDTARIELNASLNLNKFLNPLGNEYYLGLYQGNIPSFTLPANRTLPVELPYPIASSDSLIYNLPAGYDLKSNPDTISIKSKYGVFALESKVIDHKIYVTKRFELFPGSYKLEQYPEFYAFIKTVRDLDRKKIIIKPVI